MRQHFLPDFLSFRVEWVGRKAFQHPGVHVRVHKFALDDAVHHHFNRVVQQDQRESQMGNVGKRQANRILGSARIIC